MIIGISNANTDREVAREKELAARSLAAAQEYAASGQAARDSAAYYGGLSPAERAEYARQTAECRQHLYMVRR